MNREMKRRLRKDKTLIKELFEIIQKYCPDLLNKFSNLTDIRNPSYIKYSMKVVCVTRLLGLLCGISELVPLSDTFNTQNTINNISIICKEKLEEIPYWETIQDVFKKMSIKELREIQKYIIKAFIRSKMFDKYKFDGAFQLIFDGTGLSHHNYNLNNNCLSRTSKDGTTTYYKYVLECKLCVGPLVISLDTEFIENEKIDNEKQKQDCETNAFKRMVKRIKKNYPKQKFLITGDALYATEPIIAICEKYHWFYIFNLKPERLKYINECFEGNILLENETTHKHYYLSTNIDYQNHLLHVFKYIENEGSSSEKNFRYISNIFDTEVTFSNINCELGDGVIYTYDSKNDKFVFTGEHAHGGIGTKPIYTKVNSIKRKGDKFELVLNKLYYNPERTDYITTDPFGVNRVYNSKDYMHTVEGGEDVDLTKLSANYENNFDELKNVGTRYKYIFGEKEGHYILEKYEVINEEE